MEKYRYLSHPADLKIQAFGTDLAQLFENAALGMMKFIYGKEINNKQKKDEQIIKIKSSDIKSLIVDWLSELLYLSDTNNCAYLKFKFIKLTEIELQAKVTGFPAQATEDIKAVTYHGLEIKRINNHWEAVVLFDI